MSYFRWMAALTVAIAAITMVSCFNSTNVKIGVIIPQEGSLAEYGYQIRSGIQMAHSEIEGKHLAGELKKKYELIWEDENENDLEGVKKSFETLKKQGVTAIIGAASSAATMALTDLANEAEIVLLSPASSSPEINTTSGDFVFRNYPSDTLEAQQLANVIFQKCLIQSVLMVRAKNTFSEGITYEVLKFGRQNRNKIPNEVVKFDPDPSKVDFVAVTDRIVNHNPNAIFMAAYSDELIPLIREIRTREELKNLYIFTCSAFVPADVIEALGKEAVEGIMFSAYPWDPNATDPRIQNFTKTFTENYHTTPGIFAATGYDALHVLVAAIDDTNHAISDEVKDQMYKMVFTNSILGELDFNKSGNVTRIPKIYKIQDGAKVELSTEDIERIKTDVLTRL